MQQAANSTTQARSLTLANVLNYSERSYKEARATLVGPESMAVPRPLSPPNNLPDLLSMGVPRVAPELDDESPLENLAELSDDVAALQEACTATINAFQETRETVLALRSDLLGSIVPLETRVPAVHTLRLVSLEDLEVGQGHVDSDRRVGSEPESATWSTT